MQVSVVIPVYRSAEILPALAAALAVELGKAFETYEVILVDDCSPDDSWHAIESLCERYPFLHGLSLRKNVGQDNAIMAGLNAATGAAVVIMDDDLQHPPAGIAPLVSELAKGYDVCFADFTSRAHAWWKRLGSAFNGWVAQHIAGKPVHLYLSPFKALHRNLVRELIAYDGPFSYIDGLILSNTSRMTQIPMRHQTRYAGEGNYNLRKSISVWLRLVTGFSVLPLRLITYLGLGVALLSFGVSAYFLLEYLLSERRVEGWISLLLMVNFFGGVQLVAIGVLGEYVGRTYLRLNKRSQFSIATRCGSGTGARTGAGHDARAGSV